jgi:hypothetical protein
MENFSPDRCLDDMAHALVKVEIVEFITLCEQMYEWLGNGGQEPSWRDQRGAASEYFKWEIECKGA